MKKKKLLTASIIAKNEEEMIGTMLDSIKGVDEIMVIDTGSTDNTVKICQEKGAKVFTGYLWEDDFAKARNVAKEKATGEWLLIIDCDEIFEQDIARLKELLKAPEMKNMDAIFMSVNTGAEVNSQIRVFRNIPNIEWFGEFHNLPYMVTARGHERIPDNRIFRSSFKITANFSPNHHRDPDRTMRILQNVIRKNPHNTRALYYMARELLNRQRIIEAMGYLNLYVRIAPQTNELADVYFILATCELDLGNVEGGLDNALKAIKLLPSLKAAWALLYNIAHPDFKQYWKAAYEMSDNKGALFVRELAEKLMENDGVAKK